MQNANSKELFNVNLNIDIVHFCVEENKQIVIINDEKDLFYSERIIINTISTQNVINDIYDVNHDLSYINNISPSEAGIMRNINLNSSPSSSEDSIEECNRINSFKKKNQIIHKKSLFQRQKPIKNSIKIKKISLSRFHEFLVNFIKDFKDFTHIATIPFMINNETKYYEILLKITDRDSQLGYEYILNDVSMIKIADTYKKEIKYKSLFLAKTAHELKNPILTISSLCRTLSSKVSRLVNVNISYQSSDEDSEEEIQNNSRLKKKDSSNLNSIQDTINFIITTGNYLMSLIYDLNYFTKRENNLMNENNINRENVVINDEFELIPALDFCLTIFKLRQKNDENKKNMKILSDYDNDCEIALIMAESDGINHTKARQN